MSITRIAVRVPVEGVKDIAERLISIEETLGCIADAMDDGTSDRYLAVQLVNKEIARLQCDLDVASWPSVKDEDGTEDAS